MRRGLALLVCLLTVAPAHAQGKRPIRVEDLFRFQRVSDPQVSPDGKSVAYVVTSVDLDGNKSTSNLWLAATDGKAAPRRLTTTDKKDRHPRWSPDGKRLLFESNRGGETQLWLLDLSGGEARQLTTISTEAGTGLWSRDGRRIAFVSAVYPEFSDKPFQESDALNKKKMEEAAKSPVKAKVFTRLFYRHWDSYVEDKRQHLFVMPFEDGKAGEPKDVTPGDRDAYPTSTTFETGDNYAFSPDGNYLVFTAVPDRDEAWSTNYDLCRVPVTGGTTAWECLTGDNPAADSGPVFSPDGKRLAYRAQKKAGYEADRWNLVVAATDAGGAVRGAPAPLTTGWDFSVDEYAWDLNGDRLVFTADQQARTGVFAARAGQPGSAPVQLDGYGRGTITALSTDGKTVHGFLRAGLHHPPELFVHRGNGDAVHVSKANDRLLDGLDLPRPESVTVEGAGGTPMQMWILKPPGFDPGKKWPLVYLVHGGPQGVWGDTWTYRWNAQTWAAQGYVVALPNPRGSTGFGQQYVDDITNDWGGKCYEDLMKGLDYLEKQPYIDAARMASAGGSFGGYMMNWFAVKNNRFKALVTHCSVWNFESMYGTTDEVWFDEYEHGGPPWGMSRASYEKFSPHKFAGNLGKYKTPMLIIHNDLDFRCPIGQGHELFTALQRQGVPSRFVNFPDEGHWVLKPKNSERWHREVFAWLKKYAPPGGK